MTGELTLSGELELQGTTDADGNAAWEIVDKNGNRRGLLTGMLHTDEISVTYNNEPAYTKNVVAVVSDNDSSTTLSADITGLPTVNRFRVVGDIGGHESKNGKIEYTVNNVTGQNYSSTRIGGGSVGSQSGSAWAEKTWGGYMTYVDVTFSADSRGSGSNRAPAISGNSAGHSGIGRYIDNGILNIGGNAVVNSIQISTDFNCTAELRVIGVSY